MSVEAFLRLLRDTYDKPQEVARWVTGLGITLGQAMMALALVAVITTFMAVGTAYLGEMMAGQLASIPVDPNFPKPPGAGGEDPFVALMKTPFAVAALQFFGMVVGAVLILRVGRLFGGQGTWDQTLPLVAWLQIVFMVLQAAQLLIVLALPILSLPVMLFTIFSVFFLSAQFIMALHGFTSLGKVLGGMILTLVVLSLGLSVLFLLLVGVTHV